MDELEDTHSRPIGFDVPAARRQLRPTGAAAPSDPTPIKLTVAMAAHNEERTIEEAVRRVLAVRGAFDLELVVVDDGSTDSTGDIVRSIEDERLVLLSHPRCRGKGAAVLAAASVATGSHLLVFDADLEYSATDIPPLVEVIIDGTASVVYGVRISGMRTAFQSSRYKLGSYATTVFTNLVFDAWLKDMHTCLKLMPTSLFHELTLSQTGFGLDTEITGELLRRGVRPYEVPCSYNARTHAAGKKISVRDGLECLKIVLQVRLRGIVPLESSTAEGKPVVELRSHLSRAGGVEEAGRVSEERPASSAARRRGHRSARFGGQEPKAV